MKDHFSLRFNSYSKDDLGTHCNEGLKNRQFIGQLCILFMFLTCYNHIYRRRSSTSSTFLKSMTALLTIPTTLFSLAY